jgi:hypothetical protein
MFKTVFLISSIKLVYSKISYSKSTLENNLASLQPFMLIS